VTYIDLLMEVSEDVLLKAVDLALGMGSSYAETDSRLILSALYMLGMVPSNQLVITPMAVFQLGFLLMVCGVSQQLATPPGTQLRMP